MPSLYDVTSAFTPDGSLTQSQGTQFTLPGFSSPGSGLDISGFGQGLGQLAQQSLDMRRQQALQQMALAERQQAMAEAQFAAQQGNADRQFNDMLAQREQGFRQHRENQMDQREAQRKARIDASRLRRAGNVPEAAFGQMIGGFGIVPGMISASGNTPGAVMTGHRQSRQGSTEFQGSMGTSRASMAGPSELFAPSFAPDSQNEAGNKSANARRQLLALR